jgi:hypothetical protein
MACRTVPVSAGSVILFDGRLLHNGAAPLDLSAFRHSLVCRYIPRSVGIWPPLWVTRAPDAASRRLSHPRIDVRGAVSAGEDPDNEERRRGGWVGRGWQLPLSERDRREIMSGGRLIVRTPLPPVRPPAFVSWLHHPSHMFATVDPQVRSVFSPQECDVLPNHHHEAANDQRVQQLAVDGCELEPGTEPLLLSAEVVRPAEYGAVQDKQEAAVTLWVALGDDGSGIGTGACRQGDCVLARRPRKPQTPEELPLCATALRLCFVQRPRESGSTPNL